ncbi:MAG: His-Xaa-Ser system radical SAM maturase HxsC [Coxiellaceae bacterium]|nr:MAG: His-Xaa-Ser system radical SAM maturase HxsC [Coxiellaceae bacterium]
MLKLYSKVKPQSSLNFSERIIAKVTDNPDLPVPLRKEIFFVKKIKITIFGPEGFKGYLIFESNENNHLNVFQLPEDLGYVSDGDIAVIDPANQSIRVLYRKNSAHNSILVTENCNNFCLMCSQPPRNINDSHLVNEILSMIPLMSKETVEIGITGGEPTLLGDGLVAILSRLKTHLPNTSVHVLTNGRKFIEHEFVEKIASVNHRDLMFGIPIYSDVSNIHDYVVQANNGFNEAVKGILNLKSFGQQVEIRVVLHKQTYKRLPKLAEFITRNLLFVDHVALMGLEMTGFTKANLNDLWVDPIEYQDELLEAIDILERFRVHVSIYNHQLCLLPKSLWRFAVKSISDWKNEYMPECSGCEMQAKCGGFFSSAHFKYSSYIKPLKV